VYARVSSSDQKADLDRQVARMTAWATSHDISVDRVVTEAGFALNGRRSKFLALLRDPSVTTIIVDPAEPDDDLVRDMTEILTSFFARLHGKRAAENRARRMVDASSEPEDPE
jgi:predicted site-specific integrase-resolvase